MEFNVTVDDTDASIFYLPPDAWYSSSDPYPDPLPFTIALAHQSSYHFPRPQLSGTNKRKRSSSSPQRDAVPDFTAKHKGRGPSVPDVVVDESGSNVGESDEQAQLSIQFAFAGAAIYIYGLLHAASGEPSQHQRFSVSIDGVQYRRAITPVPSTPTSMLLFGQSGLSDGPHTLEIIVGNGVNFLFDYLEYTTPGPSHVMLNALPQVTTTDIPASSAAASAQPSSSAGPDKKRNVTTFAAAVGGSVGVLAVLATGLAISIIRRRHLAAKREAAEREANPNDPERIRQQQMAMAGPDVFIPRFFPGTEMAPGDSPPPYTPPLPTMRASVPGTSTTVENPAYTYALPVHPAPMTSPYIHLPRPHHVHSPSDLSYADIPPDSPPPPSTLSLNDDLVHPPPQLGSTPPPSLPPNFPTPRLTHVNVGVGNDEEEEISLPPGITTNTTQGQSSGERLQLNTQSPQEHARNTSQDDDAASRHSAAGTIAPGGESVPLLAASIPSEASPRTRTRGNSSGPERTNR